MVWWEPDFVEKKHLENSFFNLKFWCSPCVCRECNETPKEGIRSKLLSKIRNFAKSSNSNKKDGEKSKVRDINVFLIFIKYWWWMIKKLFNLYSNRFKYLKIILINGYFKLSIHFNIDIDRSWRHSLPIELMSIRFTLTHLKVLQYNDIAMITVLPLFILFLSVGIVFFCNL